VRLSPPQNIKISPANATEEEGITGIVTYGVPTLQVAKPAQIALKGANEMVTIPTLPVPQQVAGWPPVKPILISRSMMVELIVRVRCVTRAAPNRLARLPRRPVGGKVCAKDTCHVAPDRATCLAPAYPNPEGLVIA
jgi:hypothetical protein